MTRVSTIVCLSIALSSGAASADERFPQPAALQPDVDFWVDIFTEYTSDQGVLHDSKNLAIVYETIDLPVGSDRRERQRRIVQHRKRVQAVLSRLSSGNHSNLDPEEERILALWPAGVGNQTLVDASRNIRYQQGLKDRFREGLVRAGRWRVHIEKEFTALGIPVELAALPHVESSYNPNARSHVGASGLWQFTRSTGRRFMRVDHVVDERDDPLVASRAAGQLLAYNYSIVGNWPMAITAYNHGLAGVRRAMRQFGDSAYADILRNYRGRTFGFASRNFYVAYLAAMHVDRNVKRYFPDLVPDVPVDYQTAILANYIPVTDLTAALGVTLREFAAYNPALQSTVWQGSKHLPKDFEIRMPASLLATPMTELLAGIDTAVWQSSQLPDLFHSVRRGDTLSQIAETYGTRVSTLVALNQLTSSHRIRAGQQLRLPAAGPAPVTEPPPPPPVVTAAEVPVGEPEGKVTEAEAGSGGAVPKVLGTVQTTLLSDPSDYSVADDGTIEIQSLETLGHFADWLEIRTQRLRDINGLAFRTQVHVGQRIGLDFGKVDAQTFEDRRVAWHRVQQDGYFRRHAISGVRDHVIRPGESIWILALRQYDVPMWLFRQYNPDVDPAEVRPGTAVRFPTLSAVDAS